MITKQPRIYAMNGDGLQLEMNFDANVNHFKQWIDNGEFVVLIEVEPPAPNMDAKTAIRNITEIEYVLSSFEGLKTGLAFADPPETHGTLDNVTLASDICESNRDRHVLYLSGKDTTLEKQKEIIFHARSAGFVNIVPVTGDGSPGETRKQAQSRLYTESIHALNHLCSLDSPGMFVGAPVNPFKHVPHDLLSQYHKLMKKINLGAGFAVTHFGWDMMKLQEVLWYLAYRGYHFPLISRELFLTRDRVVDILKGRYPGVHISPDFKLILEKEAHFSHNQFEAAQWRRLQMHIAGCRHLGYSGVQVAGFTRATQVATFLNYAKEALEEFSNFEEWKKEYIHYMGRAEMAPYPYRFYLFSKLFANAQPEANPRLANINLPIPTKKERLLYHLKDFLFHDSDKRVAQEHLIMKKLLTGCRRCSYCRLPLTHYLCPEGCPKNMANGPCGGAQVDGTCEFGGMSCVPSRRLLYANWLKDIHRLEEEYIKPSE